MRKAEYDFLNWTSFPSSIKLISDEPRPAWLGYYLNSISVAPGAKLKFQINLKQNKVLYYAGGLELEGYDGKVWRRLVGRIILQPFGSFNWTTKEAEYTVPLDIVAIRMGMAGGGTNNPAEPAESWFDDLRVYQDDVLIYSNDFSNWDPMIGAGVGAPIGGVAGYLLKEPLGPMVSEVVGAVVGGAVGGGIGLLTGLGIIPVPQIPIPSLGAAPEGPEAPARMSKYQITG